MNTAVARKRCDGLSCDAEGAVVAVLGKLDAVDLDADVVVRGAVPSGAPVLLSEYGHSAIMAQMSGAGLPVAAPVGRGTVDVEGDQLMFHGRFFPSARGEEARTVAREMGDLQQWSWSFRILQSGPADGQWKALGARRVLKKVDPFEVSPVTLGAGGRLTRTVSVKGSACGCNGSPGASCSCSSRSKQPDSGEVAQLAAEFAKFQRREAQLFRPPPPVHLVKFLAFAAARLGIPSSDTPRVVMVKAFDDGPDKAGAYHPALHLVKLRDDLRGLDLLRVAAHELSHAEEALAGRAASEQYAEASAEDILAAWSPHRWRNL